MAVSKRSFGKLKDGREVFIYDIENKNGMKASVMTYGANLVSLYVPGKKGRVDDVVLGYDRLWMYTRNDSNFGCTIGPIAGRTAGGKFKVGTQTVKLEIHDMGINNLHTSSAKAFQRRIWEAETGKDSVTFSLFKKHNDLTPGNMTVSVTYSLTSKNELKIHYHAEPDRDTAINMTNHSYFNLSGQKSMSIMDTKVKIYADKVTAVDEKLIPNGNSIAVKGTPLDFTEFKKIGKDIKDKSFEPLASACGYNHNYELKGYNGKLKKAAEAVDEKSGRRMEVYTDLPGLQFYSGIWIGKNKGKEGQMNCKSKGFAMETQYFPDACNQESFIKPVFGPGKPYDTVTVYRFYWDD